VIASRSLHGLVGDVATLCANGAGPKAECIRRKTDSPGHYTDLNGFQAVFSHGCRAASRRI